MTTEPSTTDALTGLFDGLRRWPDVEADNLFAFDATDRLLLDTAHEAIVAAGPAQVAVIGDNYGALTLGSIAAGAHLLDDPRDDFLDSIAGFSAAVQSGSGLLPSGVGVANDLHGQGLRAKRARGVKVK